MGSNSKTVLKISLCLALVTLVALGIVLCEGDESSAATSGDIKNTSDVKIGEYAFSGYTLRITATSPSNATELTLVDFDHQADVQILNVEGFVNDVYLASFLPSQGYTNLESISYSGKTADDDGTWEYRYFDHELIITAGENTSLTDVVVPNFELKSSVESVILEKYTENLSGSFGGAYSSLDGNIFYKGVFGSNGGQWNYSMKTKTFIVDRDNNHPSSTVPGYNYNPNADPVEHPEQLPPFMSMFFHANVEHVEYNTYSGNCAYLFYGLTPVKTFRAPAYDVYSSNGLLEGMTVLEELYYDKISTVNNNTVSKVYSTLKVFSAATANTVLASAFVGCSSLTTVNLPAVTTVRSYAFNGCSSLASVNLESATTIETYAFNNCSSLRDITLPSLVTVNSYTFAMCISLRTVTLNAATTITGNAFSGCGSLDTVTLGTKASLGDNAFNGCSSLRSITASNITSIGYNAFRGCSSLSGSLSFTYLNTIYSDASRYPFYGCTSLTGVEMPRITTMYPYSFNGCTNLSSVVIGDTLGVLPERAFSGCGNLDSLTLGESVYSIGDFAFYDCSSLLLVTLPDTVESIGAYAFMGSGITILDTNNVISIGESAFQNSGITNLTIGDAVQTIGNNAFRSSSVAGGLVLPNSIRTVGNGAFYGTQIETLRFLDDTKTTFVDIGESSFSACSMLVSVTLGDRVKTIGNDAFKG
ncbi:MAG: leucine-rich repeat domain-containing protein, partial [Candidatus Methanomethylophilaceae archaeon]|nr:leucine-rich repeat domain-containing protein [Candidatus Methanomethylophilaceae archaeon]